MPSIWATRPGANSTSNTWHYAGLASSFPNITPSQDNKTRICRPLPDPWDEPKPEDSLPQICKTFSKPDASSTSPNTALDELPVDKANQDSLLIFKYREKVYAMEHACPHQAYPLTRATVSDIEDFGIVLSAGITCPKHGWTFDLTTGEADTGRYKLGLYEVDLREGDGGEEVWLRKKERRRIG
ncbi:rieske [2Fe-2S] domain-containing protein [Elsinoe australis]|uniref:Rieske [2Fe-2S] domain-containing protein n=1 Tax=Elsinoe australis TaxID=40998 RepID=A0A4U7B4S8_9PEZI|nr:rieske [2Fe-2S] domain-containing protein [Elsinoe australis]